MIRLNNSKSADNVDANAPRLEVPDDKAEGGGDAPQDDHPEPACSPLLGVREVY